VHWLRCYGNITRTRNVSEYMLVLSLCLVIHQNSNLRDEPSVISAIVSDICRTDATL